MALTIITREECGLAPPTNTDPLDVHHVDEIVLHHTAELPPIDPRGAHDEAHDAAAAQWRGIQWYYFTERHYWDIAYHYGIAPDGVVYEGRHLDVLGAHALNCNTHSWGVVMMAEEAITAQQEEAFRELWALLNAHKGGPLQVVPHSQCTATACPGDTIRAFIHTLQHPAPVPAPPPPAPHPTPCAALPPGPPPPGRELLKLGSTGVQVQDAQGGLASHGFPPANSLRPNGTWDGIFGHGTETAVRDLQAHYGLKVDGVIGRQVWCVLGH